MRDITCGTCKKIIGYNQYKEQIRAVKFEWVQCPHCGAFQELVYVRIKGTGNKDVTQFEHIKKKMLNPKKETYHSCGECDTYFPHTEDEGCPFCQEDKVVGDDTARFVPTVKNPTKELFMHLAMDDLKTQWVNLHHGLEIREKVATMGMDNIPLITFNGTHAVFITGTKENESDIIYKMKLMMHSTINKISRMETKLKLMS